MQLKIYLIVLVTFFAETCFTEIIIAIPKQNTFDAHLLNATVEVLSSCYGRLANAVGIHGDQTGLLFRVLLSKQTLPVILMDNTVEVLHNDSARSETRHKLQLFTIIASSTTQLQEDLKKIKNSPWWNHMARFLILNWITESGHECSNAFKYLWAAWEMNVLNVNFMCVNQANKVLLYTYNPYTNKAPRSWEIKQTFRGHFDHPWSMFVREYEEGEVICKGLDFDKTKDLGGYVISSAAQNVDPFWYSDLNKTGIDSFGGMDGSVAKVFFRVMNASVKLMTYSEDAELIGWNDKGETTGVALDVAKGINDILLLSFYQESFVNQTVTYPHWNTGLGVVTQYRSALSQLAKIKSVIDISSRFGLYAVMLITILFFKFFVRQPLVPAILNTLRITCNSPLPTVPNTTSTRIYLGSLFFFQITILALYQGQLASLLTKEVYVKNVNTMQELADSGHTVHAHKPLSSLLMDPALSGRFVGHKNRECSDYVVSDPSAACVEDWDALISKEMPLNLHLSQEPIIKMSTLYAIRQDWPPERRLNKILARMTETDIIRRTYIKQNEKVLSINEYYKNSRKSQGPKVMTLRQLSFAFAILGIGIGCATVIFIIEIIIALIH